MMTPEERATHREAFAQALRDIAHQVLINPGFPVPRYPSFSISAVGLVPDNDDWEAIQGAIRNAAEAMGVEAEFNDSRTHLVAERSYGPIDYRFVGIDPGHMKSHAARQSYADVVQP